MPVIIDQIDLVDTRPDRSTPADSAGSAPQADQASPSLDRTAAALRAVERRAARVRAD